MAAKDDTNTWNLIHVERAAMADTLAALTPEQWAQSSLCGGWSVRITAAHILAGAEQTLGHFFARMAANGFRFNTMMDRDARRLATIPPGEIIERIRATTATTNHPPAAVMAMLGEIVVHGEDIRRPLGVAGEPSPAAVAACLEMFSGTGFPVGAKRRIDGLHLLATDLDWSHGAGAEVRGPALSLLMAMTGRPAGWDGLEGNGLATLSGRVASTS
jgi:uncharacterized protein (TIGR03083 family)